MKRLYKKKYKRSMMMKKIISIMLIVIMIFSMMPHTGVASASSQISLNAPVLTAGNMTNLKVNSFDSKGFNGTMSPKWKAISGISFETSHLYYKISFTANESGEYVISHTVYASGEIDYYFLITGTGLSGGQKNEETIIGTRSNSITVNLQAGGNYHITFAAEKYLLTILNSRSINFSWDIRKESDPEPTEELLDLILSHTDSTGTYYMLHEWTNPINYIGSVNTSFSHWSNINDLVYSKKIEINRYRQPSINNIRPIVTWSLAYQSFPNGIWGPIYPIYYNMHLITQINNNQVNGNFDYLQLAYQDDNMRSGSWINVGINKRMWGSGFNNIYYIIHTPDTNAGYLQGGT